MLQHTDLKKGVQFILNGQPYEVLEASLNFRGRGSSVLQTKIRNLITGNVIAQTFRQADSFEEAELKKKPLKFIYSNKRQYVFSEPNRPAERFTLTEEQIGEGVKFLKQNREIEGIVFRGKIINIVLPIKVSLQVKEAPPGIKAGRAEAGTKQVTLETGVLVNAPLFIKEGDVIEINTETGEYVRRVE